MHAAFTGPRSGGGWLSAHEAAATLGVHVREVYRLIDAGRLPGYMLPGDMLEDEIRVRHRDVRAVMRDAG